MFPESTFTNSLSQKGVVMKELYLFEELQKDAEEREKIELAQLAIKQVEEKKKAAEEEHRRQQELAAKALDERLEALANDYAAKNTDKKVHSGMTAFVILAKMAMDKTVTEKIPTDTATINMFAKKLRARGFATTAEKKEDEYRKRQARYVGKKSHPHREIAY